jgi:hypothetical protein
MAHVFKNAWHLVIDEMIITKIICSLPLNYTNIMAAWDNLPTTSQTIRGLTTQSLKQEHSQRYNKVMSMTKTKNPLHVLHIL